VFTQNLKQSQKALSIAKRMHLAGMSMEQIMDITELTKEELEKLLHAETI